MQRSATIGQCPDGDYGWLLVKRHQCGGQHPGLSATAIATGRVNIGQYEAGQERGEEP
jgi:hypothetical protein